MRYSIIFIIVSFAITLVIGKMLIPLFKTLKLGQHIREDAPKNHIKKAGTPTFGGIIFIFPTLITCFVGIPKLDNEVQFLIYSLIIFALIGFADDALKTIHRDNKGLSSLQKMLLLVFGSIYCMYYIYKNLSLGTEIILPFKMELYNLGILYIPFVIFFYASMTNAVNLTDGLDGLATSVSVLVLIFFAIISFYLNKYSISLFCSILSASLIGFLVYNAFPAKIIMGDTGSIALGGTIATVAILLKLQLIILIVGGIYLLETLPTLLQIISFKLTGKRIFKMTPIHHSLELSGWHEVNIVTTFSIITALLCIIGFLSLLS
jgi:phospho-N-acetylmuramoyl-pentapeptide-transferase